MGSFLFSMFGYPFLNAVINSLLVIFISYLFIKILFKHLKISIGSLFLISLVGGLISMYFAAYTIIAIIVRIIISFSMFRYYVKKSFNLISMNQGLDSTVELIQDESKGKYSELLTTILVTLLYLTINFLISFAWGKVSHIVLSPFFPEQSALVSKINNFSDDLNNKLEEKRKAYEKAGYTNDMAIKDRDMMSNFNEYSDESSCDHLYSVYEPVYNNCINYLAIAKKSYEICDKSILNLEKTHYYSDSGISSSIFLSSITICKTNIISKWGDINLCSNVSNQVGETYSGYGSAKGYCESIYKLSNNSNDQGITIKGV